MGLLRANYFRGLVTFVLAVSVSTCCCQAHFLLHGLSGAADDLARSGATSAGATSAGCCTDCSDDAPGDDRPSAPEKSCKVCCVKGSGLKDGIAIPPIDIADVLPLFAETPVIASTRSSIATPPPVSTAPYVEVRTLVRLHCALIV